MRDRLVDETINLFINESIVQLLEAALDAACPFALNALHVAQWGGSTVSVLHRIYVLLDLHGPPSGLQRRGGCLKQSEGGKDLRRHTKGKHVVFPHGFLLLLHLMA